MKRSFVVKLIALFLTSLSLIIAVCSGIGIIQLVKYNLYATDNLNDYLYKQLDFDAFRLAESLAERYAVLELTNCEDEDLKELGYRNYVEGDQLLYGFSQESYSYTITTKTGEVLESFSTELTGEVLVFETSCSKPYPVIVTDEKEVNALYGKDVTDSYTYTLSRFSQPVTIREYASPDYTVTVTMKQDSALIPYGTSVDMLAALYSLRYVLIFVLALSVIMLVIGIAYLCAVAGSTSKKNVTHRGALNYVPLDIYAAGGALFITQLLSLSSNLIYSWTSGKEYNAGTLSLVGFVFLGVSFILLGFLYAVATQVKLPKGYWYRHSFLYWLGKRTFALLDLLPAVWRLLVPGLFGLTCFAACVFAAFLGYYWPLSLAVILSVILVVYCSYAFGCLLQGAKRMSQGTLDAKLDVRYLIGAYRQCADHLNELADVAIVAARKQMQADRMKTELITNVSHDIKTPLTSIINYVDILQHAQNREDALQYMEVLGRQSQRLKKLIEDLMELSKASSGSMPVHILCLNAEETINQVLGEFSDKLEQANLDLVFLPGREDLSMMADGRLSWRVLSNLFSNAVKYAMPGTRVYLELTGTSEHVVISLKNISREPLNISAEELTERFVRGDASRKTEGSGLGLNIAKSLMELQNGKLELLVDGDLFKATLLFPRAFEPEEE